MSPVVVGRWKFGRGADPNPVIKVTSKVTPSALKEEISYSGNGRTRDAIICGAEKRTEIRFCVYRVGQKLVQCCVISSLK